MDNVLNLDISQLRELLDKGELTSEELTTTYLDRIKSVDEKVHAYVTLTEEDAIKQAKKADEIIRKGEAAPLTGIPLGIKDVICTEGIPTTCSSKMLENFRPPFDATVIEKFKAQGAVMTGKLNMDEFAMGSSTENSAFFPTKNPWDLDRIPGGSSGGSAAAVAARMCVASLGSDTGGSIRQPASHCGVVGLKPTYGLVSRYGLVAFASSLDQIGPLTRSVKDAAIILESIAGHDQRDSTSLPMSVPAFSKACTQGMKGMKVGVPKEYFIEGLQKDVETAIQGALKAMEDMGAEIVDISLPHTEYAIATYYIIATAEASSNLSRYDGVKYGFRAENFSNLMEMYKETRAQGFGMEVKRRIMLGTYCLSAGYYDAFYKKASQVRTLIIEDFKNAFKKCDVIAAPVAPTTAFKIGEKVHDPLQMYLSDIFTIPVNLAGIPGMSVPCGFDSEGLPVGMQIMAAHLQEETLFKAAYSLEKGLGLDIQWPELT
ncbi:MAG: Asp-tRNA(Asn)/Glu-tRNA(Gln) amidotransferase subunit GatA [Thermodesulfobacteria bacterium]|nr:Asp-tRNA(Asn)/Glu-tRNA(Gln) amidotransferase subunit GatA [Thermodesulfobacteriota bacterium]